MKVIVDSGLHHHLRNELKSNSCKITDIRLGLWSRCRNAYSNTCVLYSKCTSNVLWKIALPSVPWVGKTKSHFLAGTQPCISVYVYAIVIIRNQLELLSNHNVSSLIWMVGNLTLCHWSIPMMAYQQLGGSKKVDFLWSSRAGLWDTDLDEGWIQKSKL